MLQMGREVNNAYPDPFGSADGDTNLRGKPPGGKRPHFAVYPLSRNITV